MYVLEKADDQKFELNAGSRPYLIQIFDHRPSQVRKSPLYTKQNLPPPTLTT